MSLNSVFIIWERNEVLPDVHCCILKVHVVPVTLVLSSMKKQHRDAYLPYVFTQINNK